MQNQKTCAQVTDLLRNNHRKSMLAGETKDGKFLVLNAKRKRQEVQLQIFILQK